MKVCPSGAIVEDDTTGAKIVEEDRCIGCRLCVIACPFGGVAFNPKTRKAIKCDLCKDIGEPQCVKWCPKDAIQLVEVGNAGSKKRALAIEKLREAAGRNPESVWMDLKIGA
jgi:Fe-S-cluster-containing hydrogenase component 2